MKRLLLVAAVGAAAALVPAPAQADHLCVTRGGQEVICAPHISIARPQQVCVEQNGNDLVCVF
jgi:hypothetical protein